MQISIWIWSNAPYNSRGNQINLAQIIILQSLFTNQIKCWFLMRGENRITRGKTSHSRVENQQTQSTYDTGCGNRTGATLLESKCSHHKANHTTYGTWCKAMICVHCPSIPRDLMFGIGLSLTCCKHNSFSVWRFQHTGTIIIID